MLKKRKSTLPLSDRFLSSACDTAGRPCVSRVNYGCFSLVTAHVCLTCQAGQLSHVCPQYFTHATAVNRLSLNSISADLDFTYIESLCLSTVWHHVCSPPTPADRLIPGGVLPSKALCCGQEKD